MPDGHERGERLALKHGFDIDALDIACVADQSKVQSAAAQTPDLLGRAQVHDVHLQLRLLRVERAEEALQTLQRQVRHTSDPHRAMPLHEVLQQSAIGSLSSARTTGSL